METSMGTAGVRDSLLAARALSRIERLDTNNLQQLLDYSLDEAIRLSSSLYGYIYYYDEDTRVFINHAWSKEVMDTCRVVEPQQRYELGTTGLWGEVVRQRRTIIENDYSGPNPFKKGCPAEHVDLVRWMSVPVFVDGRIVAVAGVANAPGDYDENDAERLEILMESVWSIAERLRLHKELVAERAKVREMTARLALVERRERAKYADEIDRGVSQPLVIAASYIKQALSCEKASDRDGLLRSAAEIVSEAGKVAHGMTSSLSPQILDDLGLPAAVAWLTSDVFGEALDCTVDEPTSAIALPEQQTALLFSAARELLGNVVRHADSRTARISWHVAEDSVTLVVLDDGAGFDTSESLAHRPGTGLMSLRERAEALGGTLDIVSSRGSGTRVEVRVPLAQSGADAHIGPED